MPDPMVVWKVELSGGNVHEDVEGMLRLAEEALEFNPAGIDDDGTPLRIEHAAIVHVKRLRLSPVLLVRWVDRGRSLVTAFYLAKPPPLTPEGSGERDTVARARMFRPSERRQRRRNSYYLTSMGTELKPILVTWVRAVQERVQDAKRA